MKLTEKVMDLRSAIEKNKLVIFVGSGVSQNSGIPMWDGLIKEIAWKLNYDKCDKCKNKKRGCKLQDCQARYQFSQDEMLKIPQYYFNKDTSKNHKKYYDIISTTLNCDVESNLINDIIMRLLPKHIITTNYDRLIENTKNPNKTLYSVIIKDKDLLTHNSNNYIIKMHGDIMNPETIVLKEDDYINYQQKHILIETYIKSLLVDHTFLFVGYSLNDYNLKLILGWIKYLAQEHSVNNSRPKNYIIQVDKASLINHINKYYESNNIFILNTNELPVDFKEKYKDILLPDKGKEVYAMLDYIYNDKNDYLINNFTDVLIEKYRIFELFKRISYEDLLSIYSFGHAELISGNLLFSDEEEFLKMKNIIISTSKDEQSIRSIFLKAGITAISYKKEFITFTSVKNIDDILFSLYLNFEYFSIITQLDNIDDNNLIAYYYYIVLPHLGNLNIKMDEINQDVVDKNVIYNLVIYKYNDIAFKKLTFQDTNKDWIEFENIISNITKPLSKAYDYLKKISIGGLNKNLLYSSDLFKEIEDQYLKISNKLFLGRSKILKLQTIAYDYYFFIKYNNLMLDYFTNPKDYFQYYIRSILCSYSPNKEHSVDNILGIQQNLEEFRLNEIDLDIIIRYTNNKSLKTWMNYYKVKTLSFENDVDIIHKFTNLCISVRLFPNSHINSYLSNYLYILTKCNLDISSKEIVISSLSDLIRKADPTAIRVLIIDAFKDIEYLIDYYKEETINSCYDFLNIILDDVIYNTICEFNYRPSIYKNLFNYSNNTIHQKVDYMIKLRKTTPEKLLMIHNLFPLFSDNQKIKYKKMIRNNLDLIGSEDLFRYLINKTLSFNKNIEQRFIKIIEQSIADKITSPGVQTFPDILSMTLDHCLILHLLKVWKNIDSLKPYSAYSDYLFFVLEPENFNYSKIDFSNYMWGNLFRSQYYQKVLLFHKKDINITESLKAIENGYATEDQKRILYKYLLTDKELWELKIK